MSGLRPLAILLLSVLLSACGDKAKDAPPPAGSVSTSDPAAAALFEKARAADQSGDSRKAMKLYDETATRFPYAEVSPQARFREADLLHDSGDLMKAFDSYQDVIQRYPSSALFARALTQQGIVAYAAADGQIKNNFLGMKSKLDSKKTVEMLRTVRENAPYATTAPKALFKAGEVYEGRKKHTEAIASYQEIVDSYPNASIAPEAQYKIGAILLEAAERGNQNQANLDKARFAFEDLLQSYPRSARAADARQRVAEIGSRDIQRSYDIAEFYLKKDNKKSAMFYFEEVLRKAKSGDLHDRASRQLAKLKAG